MNRLKYTILLATLLVTIATSGCASVAPTPTPLTIDMLKNAEYQSELAVSKKVKLTNGVYQETLVTGAASKLTVRLLDQYAIGDLNGEGADDAAVVLVSDMGGSGTFIVLAAVINDGGLPKHVGSAALGDRVQIKSVSISQREIVVEVIKHGPKDPLCCPTVPDTERYKLQGGLLVPVH